MPRYSMGMRQVTALEMLGTFVDFLNPVVNQEFLGSGNLNLILARRHNLYKKTKLVTFLMFKC